MKRTLALLVVPSRLFFVAMVLLAITRTIVVEEPLRTCMRWAAVGLLIWGLIYPFARNYSDTGRWFGSGQNPTNRSSLTK